MAKLCVMILAACILLCGVEKLNACTFEDRRICGYSQDGTDQFDWTRHKGPTKISNTGPTTDHTLGTGAGYYMYIESRRHYPGEVARLLTPLYKPTTAPQCVSFWYHMYGKTIGTLSVKIKSGGVFGADLWSISGNQGNKWNFKRVTITPIKAHSPYNVVFSGTIGEPERKGSPFSFKGDISIDDVTISACPAQGNQKKILNVDVGDSEVFLRFNGRQKARLTKMTEPREMMRQNSFTLYTTILYTSTQQYQPIVGDWTYPWMFLLRLERNKLCVYLRRHFNPDKGSRWEHTVFASGCNIPMNKLVQVGFSWDRKQGKAAVYSNGIKCGEKTTVTGSLDRNLQDNSHSSFQLGYKGDGGQFFNGLIGKVCVKQGVHIPSEQSTCTGGWHSKL